MRSPAIATLVLVACSLSRSSDPGGDARARAAAAPLDTSCTADADCVPAPGCCPVPCTSTVINQKELARARAELQCDPRAQCPVAGGCRGHAYLCIRSGCALVFEGDADYRPRQPAP